MIGALVGIGFLVGFLGGWAVVPVMVAAAVLIALAAGRYWVLAPVLALALVAGAWRAPDVDTGHEAPDFGREGDFTGIVTSAVVDDGVVQRFSFRVDDWTVCARTFARLDLGRGDRLAGELDLAGDSTISAGYRQYLQSRQCDAAGTLGKVELLNRGDGVRRDLDEVRQLVTRTIIAWIPGDRGALLAGLVIGDDSLMSDGATDAFARTGTIHVVAVSGSNLALLASILVITNVLFTRRLFSESLGIAIIWSYVLLGGAVPPTLRAGMLATFAAGSRLVGRPADVLTLSIQVAAIQAALWPATTLGLSYRLSTVAIFGVVLATSGRSFDGWFSGLRLVAMTTIVVGVAMMPILPEDSRPILIVSLLTNIAIAPLIAVSFTLGVLAIGVGWLIEPLGKAIAVVAGQLNGVTLEIVKSMADVQSLPGPMDGSGTGMPGWLLWIVTVAFLASVSKEFRRSVRDLASRTVVTDRMAQVATGAAVGAVCATIGLALLR